MAEVREPAGPGYAILTVLGVLFFLVVVAVLIRAYDSGSDVAAVGPPVTSAAPSSSTQTATDLAPVGAVATGGGGTAAASGGFPMPVLAGLAAVTMLTAGGVVLRRREA